MAEADKDQSEDKVQNERELVSLWVKRIDESNSREEMWRKDAKDAVAILEADKDDVPYNILYANTQILAPSVYNNPPKPRVKRRYNDIDPIGKAGATVVQRVLEYLIDDSDPNYATIDGLSKKVVLEGLVPGRGLAKVKYDPVFSGGEGEEQLVYETVCGEHIPYDRFNHGYGKVWSDVPWISFTHYKTKAEVKEILKKNGQEEELAEDLSYSFSNEAMKNETAERYNEDSDTIELAEIYEIWDKVNRKVIFIASKFDDKPLFELDDPLQLSGFYNIPEPISFFRRITGITPQVLYKVYRNQAKELNDITIRISKILNALKVRGFYDGEIGNIAELFQSPDNTLLPAENVAKFEGKSLDNFIWIAPLSELVGVLQQLYAAREQIKGVIFELTGIADIMRGDTAASETLGAQNLKSQWGSMRLKEMQREAARFVRDLLRLMAELSITKLSQDTIIAMTELEYPKDENRQQWQMEVQQLEMQKATIMQQTTQQGAPLEEVQKNMQEIDQQVDTLNKKIAIPTWEEILGMLQNDMMRQYKIDIETNSTIEIEASEDKQEVAEFMNAFAQFMNGIAPLVESGQMDYEVAKSMMLAITRKYRFGEEVEDKLANMQAPPEKSDPKADAEQAKLQMDQQRLQLDMQAKQQEMELKKQSAMLDMQVKQAKAQQDEQNSAREAERSQAEHNLKMLELAQTQDTQNKKFMIDMKALEQKEMVNQAKAEQQLNQARQKATT